jgi:hypothetical protein
VLEKTGSSIPPRFDKKKEGEQPTPRTHCAPLVSIRRATPAAENFAALKSGKPKTARHVLVISDGQTTIAR